MKSILVLPLLLGIATSVAIRRDDSASASSSTDPDLAKSGCPIVVDSSQNVTYEGVYQSGVEAFLGIHYGQDTGGLNLF